MSDMQKLKQSLAAVANDAKATANSLGAFKNKFSHATNAVQSSIGGTASRKDQQIISTIESAQKQVDAAINALQTAAKTASDYSAQL